MITTTGKDVREVRHELLKLIKSRKDSELFFQMMDEIISRAYLLGLITINEYEFLLTELVLLANDWKAKRVKRMKDEEFARFYDRYANLVDFYFYAGEALNIFS